MAKNNGNTHDHPLIDLISTGTRRSQIVPRFPFLAQPTPVMCKCQHVNFEAQDVLEHLWHKHVLDTKDWTEQQLSTWLWSVESRGPVLGSKQARRVRSEECKQRAQQVRAAYPAALAALEQPTETDKIIVHGLGVRFE